MLFWYLQDEYTKNSGRYCFTSWATGDWVNRIVGKTVDECKDLCASTSGCTMITHGTHGAVENNCVLCTSGSELQSADWTTTYAKIGITKCAGIITYCTLKF